MIDLRLDRSELLLHVKGTLIVTLVTQELHIPRPVLIHIVLKSLW